MIKLFFALCLTAMMLAGCSSDKQVGDSAKLALPDGITLVEIRNDQGSDKVAIAYSKYKLDNGLTVILHEDNSDPLVHVDVTYHVGSAREELGKSGFAHFFEHMMFQGSKHVADEEHFKIITEAGGDMNGTTNSDRTNYYQTVPANQLEKVLWLEADRMGFLLDAVTQEKFENQRETVKNERGENYENQPYGLRTERVAEALYPEGHPYSWSTIGYIDDLNRVSVNDLKAFFQRWYGPNNAVITIGGDIDVLETLSWVKKYFAPIPAGPEVESMQKMPVSLDADRYITLEDQVHLPLIQLTFPTVYVNHPDEAPLDVLSDILGGGKTSLFYKNLVKDNFAIQAFVSHPCRELACQFDMVALANPEKSTDLKQLQQLIEVTLTEFESRGVNEDDLARTKASIRSMTILGLQSVAGKVTTLAMNQLFSGQPDQVQYDLDRYNAVTAKDVMRVYRKYIKDKEKVILSIVPDSLTQLAANQANFALPERSFTASSVSETVETTPIQDVFDRSVMPVAGPNPAVQVPQFTRKKFDNGITMLAHGNSETPTVTILLNLEGGPLLDSIDKAGLASFTASMMNESTQLMSNEEMANQLALLGSQIQFSAGGRYTQIRVNSLVENLDETLALLKMKLFHPAFLEEDFQRIKQNLIQQLLQRKNNPAVLASRVVDNLLYGSHNVVSLPSSGTVETVSAIELDDIKMFYQRFYTPSKANLVIVGDINEKSIAKKLGFLTQWPAKDYTIPAYAEFPVYSKSKIYLVNKPDASQSVVRIIEKSLPYDATGEHFKSQLMNFPLGGMFNSRINLNLREDKGYTYGASSQFIGGKTLGRFQAGADLKQQNTADGIKEILNEIKTYQRSGMTEAELSSMRSAYTQSEALNYETPYNKASFLNHLLTFDLAKEYRQEQTKIINSITREELNTLAAKLLDTNDMQIVVVGDAQKVKGQLDSLGMEIVILESEDF
ncbi:pitrilysin family protein [Aliiglaciecola litoralis]|uniref:Pitrilysin family protein n=1 Tax=Aliiglaciecola litoralis TaxID=582857 RepID=A0ABN1LLM1_9ALTE